MKMYKEIKVSAKQGCEPESLSKMSKMVSGILTKFQVIRIGTKKKRIQQLPYGSGIKRKRIRQFLTGSRTKTKGIRQFLFESGTERKRIRQFLPGSGIL